MNKSRNAVPLSSLPPHLRAQAEAQLGIQPVVAPEAKAPRALQPMKEKRIRQSTKPLMNKLESDFYEYLKSDYKTADIFPQSVRLMLANGSWYKPDFFVMIPEKEVDKPKYEVRVYETKGPKSFRGGFEYLKIAAAKYPHIRFSLVWRENNQWKFQPVLP